MKLLTIILTVLTSFLSTIEQKTLQSDFTITVAEEVTAPMNYPGALTMQGDKFLLSMYVDRHREGYLADSIDSSTLLLSSGNSLGSSQLLDKHIGLLVLDNHGTQLVLYALLVEVTHRMNTSNGNGKEASLGRVTEDFRNVALLSLSECPLHSLASVL